MRIYISGLHSGPNPAPGVGTARSLRLAYPDATLVGVDYSMESSGIHYDGFDELWVQRPWSELDLDVYRDEIRRVVGQDAVWISGLDMEVRWLAEALPDVPGILIPPLGTLEQTVKPAIRAARGLPVSVPDYIMADRPAWELHRFCRRKGWPVWAKSSHQAARLVRCWKEALEALEEAGEIWSRRKVFLQTHVRGHEESIAFCAHNGALLSCVHSRKKLVTPDGKVWAGQIAEVESGFLEQVRKLVANLNWTGGAEFEFVRDEKGTRHLIDWNPRFPAWVHGATLAGHNLPARLLEAVGFGAPKKAGYASREFTRIVIEVPVRPDYPIPPPPATTALKHSTQQAKHNFGLPSSARRLAEKRPGNATAVTPEELPVPPGLSRDLMGLSPHNLVTPKRLFLRGTAQELFDRARTLSSHVSQDRIPMDIAYSVKTNPDPALMTLARESGFLAEVISWEEMRWAAEAGFPPQRIILNGPGQRLPEGSESHGPLCAVFADSLERLEELSQAPIEATFVGVRLRPVTTCSRFGVSLKPFDSFSALVTALRRLDGTALGLHFHIQSDVIGVDPWWEMFDGMLQWAKAIQEAVGPVQILDVGGGWFPEDFWDEFAPRLPAVVDRVHTTLPELKRFVVEPGKALAQPTMAMAMRVLEVRRGPESVHPVEVVVDSSVSELPTAALFPHRVLALTPRGEFRALPDGEGRILGRNCMETDILALGVGVPGWVSRGTLLFVCDAGGYDASMSYRFGAGIRTGA